MKLSGLRPGRRASVIANQLSTVASTLCRQCWSGDAIDRQFRGSLAATLNALGADALVARFARERVTLSFVPPSSALQECDIARILQLLDSKMPDWSPAQAHFHYEVNSLAVIGSPIFEVSGYGHVNENDHASLVFGYSALIFTPQDDETEDVRFQVFSFHGQATVSLFFQVLQHRVRLFLPFPPQIAERYWRDALVETSDPLVPPWLSDVPIPTVTLSFDLRKSTFCMETASDQRMFAYWLDDLVQILTRVAHLFGGVFDKFTGDGGLVHFLERESNAVYRRTAIVAAVHCAIALQKATKHHLRLLREFIRLDSRLLGGAIGIDTADASWSLDHRHNPITVGKGVVYACRVGDGTPANAVRLTNIAFRCLRREGIDLRFDEVSFSSKEYADEMKLTAWQLSDAPDVPLDGEDQVYAICESVLSQSKLRRLFRPTV